MKIRTKIMLGFLILALMLVVAGAFSIYELTTIGSSVQKLLDDNYRSITAAKKMTGALEREDSGILLLLSGKWKQGRETITVADANFQKAFETAESNLTIQGEKGYVDKIRTLYKKYKGLWNRPIVGTQYEGNLNWYFEDVHSAFKDVKTAVQELMAINDKAMYETASNLKNRAHRAVMPGIVAILSALVFTLIFNFFVNIYIVNPILSINRSINDFMTKEEPVLIDMDTNDELSELADSVSQLASMTRLPG
ncbi:MAG: MCP four helix bundle domain-containing protein [Desulfosalsimonadaceae bacterium]